MGGGKRRPARQNALNICALVGWVVVIATMLVSWDDVSLASGSSLQRAILILESICAFEVLQIVIGTAQGNLALGIILHLVRLLVITVILPALPTVLASKLIVVSWALTEICRYPMFLRPRSTRFRTLRYLIPVLTFPIGAGAEAWAAYLSLAHMSRRSPLLRGCVALVAPSNVILGALIGYPTILKRARSELKSIL